MSDNLDSTDYDIVGVNRRTYPHPEFPGRGIDIVCVLVAGSIGDYAAYIAGGRNEHYAARRGDKLRFEEARCHFPSLDEKRYRP